MGTIIAKSRAKKQTIHAVVTRADGTVEDLGMVAYWHKNPLKRLAWRLYRWFKDALK